MASPLACTRCGRSLAGRAAYLLGADYRCLNCALCYRPMLKRSALTALVVGTILILINQGGILFSGTLPASLAWKIPLTYLVPFCVATWGALGNSRRTRLEAQRRTKRPEPALSAAKGWPRCQRTHPDE